MLAVLDSKEDPFGRDAMTTKRVFNNGYAVVVGAGGDLPVTANDAVGFHSILVDQERCAIPNRNVRLLKEEEATRGSILDNLDWLASKAREDKKASIIFYFSGHGGFLPQYHI